MNKYKLDQIVYIIANGNRIEKGKIIKIAGDFYTIRLKESLYGNGGIKLRESRLYSSEKEAIKVMMNNKKQ